MLHANIGNAFEAKMKFGKNLPLPGRFLNLCQEMRQPNDCLRRMRLMCVGVIIR